jgi:Kef-type K+ transport system membrane component KefB
VIWEVISGILLGPSFLGWSAPGIYAFILPSDVVPPLAVVAQLGVTLYMFVIGLELNPDRLRGRVRTTVAISNASIVLPFALGLALAQYLYPRFSTSDVPFASFGLFFGVAMSITAFPVLARILSDRGMSRSELGILALTCAAVGDVTAWCLLALVAGVAQAHAGSALLVSLMTLIFIAVMFVVVRPMTVRIANQSVEGSPARGAVAVTLVALAAASLVAETIGVHTIFGAFLLGAVIPHDSPLARAFERRLNRPVTILLLPAFFALAGMRTEIGLLSGWNEWLAGGLIIATATAGKFGGTLVAGWATGLRWGDAAALGVLMNTRGLMELIVLNVGLELGVISPALFAMMVLMALVTTVAATPVLERLVPAARSQRFRVN